MATQFIVVTFCSYGQRNLDDPESRVFAIFRESVKRALRTRDRIVLLTDYLLDCGSIGIEEANAMRAEIQTNELLYCRAKMYLDFLRTYTWQQPVALLDYDTVIVRDYTKIFACDEDVLVTLRPYSKQMPINGGVVLLNNKNPDRVIRFYDDVVSCYGSYRGKVKDWAWWGDQLSLHEAIRRDGKATSKETGVTRSGASVRFLPREIYNYTPYDVDNIKTIPLRLESPELEACMKANIVHFKGPRKHLMTDLHEHLSLVQ